LSISEETVKRHLSNIYAKMGVSSRLELAMLALGRDFRTD
jgi:DNA-binding NarL/FixJ family response regulator